MTNDTITIAFANGTEVPVTLFRDRAPETCDRLLDALPIEGEGRHSRWSGREINTTTSIDTDIPRENQTAHTNHGDVVYWRDWLLPDDRTTEALAIYYGPEYTRGPQGPLRVNSFGRVPQSSWDDLTIAGRRIWQNGSEPVMFLLSDE